MSVPGQDDPKEISQGNIFQLVERDCKGESSVQGYMVALERTVRRNFRPWLQTMVEDDAFCWNVWALWGFKGRDEGLICECRHFFVWSYLASVVPHNLVKAREPFFIQWPSGDSSKSLKLLRLRPIFFFYFSFSPSSNIFVRMEG